MSYYVHRLLDDEWLYDQQLRSLLRKVIAKQRKALATKCEVQQKMHSISTNNTIKMPGGSCKYIKMRDCLSKPKIMNPPFHKTPFQNNYDVLHVSVKTLDLFKKNFCPARSYLEKIISRVQRFNVCHDLTIGNSMNIATAD